MQRIRKTTHVHFSKDFILSSFGQKIQGDFFENNLAKIQKITTSVSGEKLLKTGKRTESISQGIHFVGSATHCLNFCEEKIDLRSCVTFLLGKLIKETLRF